MNIRCCGMEPMWIENVPGKGYNFCGECRQEVLTPVYVEEVTVEIPVLDIASIDLRWYPSSSPDDTI